MTKQLLTKKQLLDLIQEKIQALNLLKSVIKNDKSRNAETMESYKKQFDQLLKGK
jgi:hypothetical protein